MSSVRKQANAACKRRVEGRAANPNAAEPKPLGHRPFTNYFPLARDSFRENIRICNLGIDSLEDYGDACVV